MTPIGPAIVYLLCLATSIACAGLLLRAWRKERSRMLLWTAAGFICLALNNFVLVVDLLLLPTIDLWTLRQATALIGVCLFLYGFIFEVDR